MTYLSTRWSVYKKISSCGGVAVKYANKDSGEDMEGQGTSEKIGGCTLGARKRFWYMTRIESQRRASGLRAYIGF